MKLRANIIIYCILGALLIHVKISWANVALDFRASIKAEPSLITNTQGLPFSNIIVIHLVNNEAKLKRVLRKSGNFETDVWFINDDFYVAHNKKDISSLTLSQLLSVGDVSQSYIWIDIKDSQPLEKSLSERLKEVLAAANIDKSRVLTKSPAQFVKELSEQGFYTSFSVDFRKNMTLEERQELIQETERLIKETGVTALEGNIHRYVMLKEYFPNMPKAVHFARPYVSIRKHLKIARLAKDPMVTFFTVEEW